MNSVKFGTIFTLIAAIVVLMSISPVFAQNVTNGSFEADSFAFPGYGTPTGWNGGNGVSANGWLFTNNGINPDGDHVAFIQGNGSLSQQITGLKAGKTYRLHYYENARAMFAIPTLTVKLGDTVIDSAHEVVATEGAALYTRPYFGRYADFTVPSDGTYTLSFNAAFDSDGALLLDDVEITEVLVVKNGNFEEDTPTFPGYQVISAWTGGGGVSEMGWPFTNNGICAGTNAAFIQGSGSISQIVTGFKANTCYCLRYAENARAGYATPTLTVTLGGRTIDPAHSVSAVEDVGSISKPYTIRTAYFTVPTDGDYSLSFNEKMISDGAFVLDAVEINEVTAVANGSFETDSFTNPGYGLPASWSYTGKSSYGINASGWSMANNGIIPDGSYVAFIYKGGTFSQPIANLKAGVRYRLYYDENCRANYVSPTLCVTLGSDTIDALHTVSAVEAAGSHTKAYTRRSVEFTVPADGTYTLAFNMTNTSGVLLLDNVRIVEVLKDDLSRGNYILLKKGFQIQAMHFPYLNPDGTSAVCDPGDGTPATFDQTLFNESYFTTLNTWYDKIDWIRDHQCMPWSRVGHVTWYPAATELPYIDKAVSFQYRDENDITDPTIALNIKNWINTMKVLYPDIIVHENQATN